MINIGSKSVDLVNNSSNKGIDIAMIDGSMFHLKSRKLDGEKADTMNLDTYKFVTKELPYPMGIHPKNMLTLNSNDIPCIEKLAKNDLLNEDAVKML